MADPTLETLETGVFAAANNGASAVYGNDAALVGAFGSLDIADNIAQDKSPIIIGPWRGLVDLEDETATLFSWTVPSATHNWELELWEMHVSLLPGMDGGYADVAHVIPTGPAPAYIWLTDGTDDVGPGGTGLSINPTTAGASHSLRLDNADNNVFAEADTVFVKCSVGVTALKFPVTISVLGYMRHRVK